MVCRCVRSTCLLMRSRSVLAPKRLTRSAVLTGMFWSATVLVPLSGRVVAAAGVETVTHSLAVVASLLADFPVNVTIIDDATNQVVIPDTIDFTVGTNAIGIGFAAAGTYNIYVSRMIG